MAIDIAKRNARQNARDAEATVRKGLKFQRTTDADIIEYTENLEEPFQAYIKRLIRADMAQHASSQGDLLHSAPSAPNAG